MAQRICEGSDGTMLFDAAQSPQIDGDWFAREFWRQRGALHEQAGGRGGIAVIDTPAGECVLRHYHRGGMIARLSGDRYLWRGANRTRSFAEFRLLAELATRGLPVPAPVAARYRRNGSTYSADLITRRIADAHTLADVLARGQLDPALAAQVGELIARFHRVGVWHADLNAHNVLVAPDGIHLIDFDRGRWRTPRRRWQRANLQRLCRSLRKLDAGTHDVAAFESVIWTPLLQGYQKAMQA